ncbi:MAG: cell wall hydrolase [Sphingomonadaceae bacterium]|nr:cell wall hydrolase [Sphingomonadaceae bacterium]
MAAEIAIPAGTSGSLLLAAPAAPAVSQPSARILTLGIPAPVLTPVAKPAASDDGAATGGSLDGMVSDRLSSATSSDEHECLAASVYFESKGQPYRGQLAVAQTIINRTKSGRFPSTVCGVVKQPHQFGFVRHGSYPAIARAGQQWREAVAIASIALKNAWSAVAHDALYFNSGHRPAPGLTRVAQIGAQIFYR